MRTDLDNAFILARGVDHGAAFDDGRRQRFFNIDVFSGLACGDRLNGMPVVGSRDDERVDILAIEKRAEILDPADVAFQPGHLGDAFAQAGEARIEPVISAAQIGLVHIAEGDDPGVGLSEKALQELAATVPDADETEPQLFIGAQHATGGRAETHGRRGGCGRDGCFGEGTAMEMIRHG